MAGFETCARATKVGQFYGGKNDVDPNDEVRLVLIGHTGDGKSSSCNSIVMEKGIFKSSASASSVTDTCAFVRRNILGLNILVVDTPGFFDTKQNMEDTMKEVSKCIQYAAPGPHAFIYVVQIGSRFSKELQDTLHSYRELFGSACTEYMLVLFTGIDKLDDDEKIDTIEKYIDSAPQDVRRLVSDCGGRVVGFNNKCGKDSEENQKQIQELFHKVNTIKMLRERYYTTSMLSEAESNTKTKEVERRKEIERQRDQQVELVTNSLRNDFDKKLKLFKSEIERNMQEREASLKREDENDRRKAVRRFEMTRQQEKEGLRATISFGFLANDEEKPWSPLESLQGAHGHEEQLGTITLLDSTSTDKKCTEDYGRWSDLMRKATLEMELKHDEMGRNERKRNETLGLGQTDKENPLGSFQGRQSCEEERGSLAYGFKASTETEFTEETVTHHGQWRVLMRKAMSEMELKWK